jgi:predicted transcriptional regulator of viral defense system
MIIHTASEGMTLARKLENDSAQFYEGLAKKFAPDAEAYLSFAKDNKKNIAQIDRAYYGVITDALEGGYAFNLETESYVLKTAIPEKAKYADVLKQAAAMEKKIIAYYTAAAEQSRALMADVPQTFLLVAKKRKRRLEKLQELLDRAGGK